MQQLLEEAPNLFDDALLASAPRFGTATGSAPRTAAAEAARRCHTAQRSRPARYPACVSSPPLPGGVVHVPGGVVHELPEDLRKALSSSPVALDAWNDITPLARNEFICWVEDAKQELTRERRIRRTQEELEEGQRRPFCWPGCKHRERTGR